MTITHLWGRVIPSFRPRFAGKCDRQSRDLTQLTSGYISRLNRLLITPDHHVRTHTWESIAQKYSMENMNIFLSSTRNRSRTPLHPSRTRSPLSYVSFIFTYLYHYQKYGKIHRRVKKTLNSKKFRILKFFTLFENLHHFNILLYFLGSHKANRKT